MTKIETVNAAMTKAPYFALSPQAISKLRAQSAKQSDSATAKS